MKRMIGGVCVLMITTLSVAQSNDYETMKEEMSSKALPLVNITVEENNINKDEYITAEIEITDKQERTDNKKTVKYKCNIKYRGASSLAYEKKSFNIKLIDETGKDLDKSIFGIREENSWILDAMAIDRVRMRNRVAMDVWNEISKTPYGTKYGNRNGTKGIYVEVFINGEYHGLYCMSDKVDRKLLGLKKAQKEKEDTITRGILYKCKSWDSASSLKEYEEEDTEQTTWNAWELQYPNDYANRSTWQPIMDIIDFCKEETEDETFQKQFSTYFHIDNLADYMVFTNALYIRDTGWKNCFLSIPDVTTDKQVLVTPWDMDTSMGGEYDGRYFDYTVDINRFDQTAPFNRLMKDNMLGYNDICRNKWEELRKTILSEKAINNMLDSIAEKLTESGAWERERNRWNNNPVELKENINQETAYIKDWYKRNFNEINRQYETNTTIKENNGTLNQQNIIVYNLKGLPVETIKSDRKHNKILKKGVYIIEGKKIII